MSIRNAAQLCTRLDPYSPLGCMMNIILLLIFIQDLSIAFIFKELEAFICKALKDEAVVYYASL